MPLQATSGAASYDAFGGGAAAVPQYIEDVFSTYLYTGNGSTLTITNGIDLSTKGGLIWLKGRSVASQNRLTDTVKGASSILVTNSTAAAVTTSNDIASFNANGFSLTDPSISGTGNNSGTTYASWTFRKQPKFFDIVTYTGNNTAGRTVAHSLGSTPGCIFIKQTSSPAEHWFVYHRSYGAGGGGYLASTTAFFADSTMLNSTSPTSTNFTLGTAGQVNTNGATYVAYIFAHDAGGFGLTGTDNVISCGSFTTDASIGNATVSLGYEPQWVMIKTSTSVDSWRMYDVMRGMPVKNSATNLNANTTAAETLGYQITPTPTGFIFGEEVSKTYIYIAIRRGPMKVPTDATKVFGLSARSGTGANATVTGGQTDDAVLVKNRGSAVASLFSSRLTGTGYLVPATTAAEVAAGVTILQANPWDVMDGVKVGTTSTITNDSSSTYINYLFKRAPSFMDVVCYTGNGTAGRTINHNLGVVPEMMIVKSRSGAYSWQIYTATRGPTEVMTLTSNPSSASSNPWNDTAPTSTVFTVGGTNGTNSTLLATYVAYLFATCAGVSKVGSYTGNGTTQTIDCGITAGARFVLIKRTDATGDWYVYDTARGMTVLTDPYLLLNTTAAETATLGSVTTVTTGFALNSTILAAINVSAASYIFLAIA